MGLLKAIAIATLATKNMKQIKNWECLGTPSAGLLSKATLESLTTFIIVTEYIRA